MEGRLAWKSCRDMVNTLSRRLAGALSVFIREICVCVCVCVGGGGGGEVVYTGVYVALSNYCRLSSDSIVRTLHFWAQKVN